MSKGKLRQKLLILPLVSLVFIGCNKSQDLGTSQGTNNLNNPIETVKQNIDDLTKNKPDLATLNKPDDEFIKNLKNLKINYDNLQLKPSQNAEIDKRIFILWLPLYKNTQTKEITEAQKELFGTANPIPTSETGKFDASAKNTQTKYLEESPKLVRDLQLKLLENQVSSLKNENAELAIKKSVYETSNLLQNIVFLCLILLIICLIRLILLTIDILNKYQKNPKLTFDLSKDSSITVKPETNTQTLINKCTEKLTEKAPNFSPLINKIELISEKVLDVLNKILQTTSIESKLKTIESSLEEIKQKVNQVPRNSEQECTRNETLTPPILELPVPHLHTPNDQNQRELVAIYNDNKLHSTYENLIAVSTEPTSIETSRTGSGKKPILTPQSPSKYWIVSISGNLYLVPKEEALNTNDMTSVEVLFECVGYKKDVSNPKDFQLVKAGKVSGGNEQWVLEEAGVLKYS